MTGSRFLLIRAVMKTQNISSQRILVVDDEPFVCDAVKMMLTFDGHEVTTAGGGKEALEVFEPGKFDLVITDFAMPSMRGDELALAIKERVPKQPILMITAYAEMLETAGGKPSAVDCVISKPFMLESLREAITKALSSGPKQDALK